MSWCPHTAPAWKAWGNHHEQGIVLSGIAKVSSSYYFYQLKHRSCRITGALYYLSRAVSYVQAKAPTTQPLRNAQHQQKRSLEKRQGRVYIPEAINCHTSSKAQLLTSRPRRESPSCHLNQAAHQIPPYFDIDHAAKTESRHNSTDTSGSTDRPVLANRLPSCTPRGSGGRGSGSRPIVQVQTEKVKGRADGLHQSRSEELGDCLTGRKPLDFVAHMLCQNRSEQGWDVERREDGHAITSGEEEIRRQGHSTRNSTPRTE